MTTLQLDNITLKIDSQLTSKFYANQNGFVCDCPDCTNYQDHIPHIKQILNGLDEKIGIDLTKDVGQEMDELMPIDYDDYHLDVIPYYLFGQCQVHGKVLENQPSGPIWPDTIRARYKVNDNLALTIINTTGYIDLNSNLDTMTIWLEYKTPLRPKQNSG